MLRSGQLRVKQRAVEGHLESVRLEADNGPWRWLGYDSRLLVKCLAEPEEQTGSEALIASYATVEYAHRRRRDRGGAHTTQPRAHRTQPRALVSPEHGRDYAATPPKPRTTRARHHLKGRRECASHILTCSNNSENRNTKLKAVLDIQEWTPKRIQPQQ